jgi:hypothetical protein
VGNEDPVFRYFGGVGCVGDVGRAGRYFSVWSWTMTEIEKDMSELLGQVVKSELLNPDAKLQVNMQRPLSRYQTPPSSPPPLTITERMDKIRADIELLHVEVRQRNARIIADIDALLHDWRHLSQGMSDKLGHFGSGEK